MKKSQVKSLIKAIVEEVSAPQQTATDPKVQAFQELDRVAKELAKLKPGTKEHADLSDRYMRIWWVVRKHLGLKENVEMPMNEYSDSDTRIKAIEGRPNDALKLIFMWVKQGHIDFKEFAELVLHWAR